MTNKLLHIVSSLEVGGAEKFVKNLSIEQLNQGDSVAVVSFGCVDDPFQAVIEQKGVKVINLKGNFFSRSKQLIQQLKQTDIIHIHSPSVIRAILPIFPFFLSKRVIYTIHGEVDPPQSLLLFSHQVARLYLNKTVAVSASAKSSVTNRYGWKSDSVEVIKNGVNVGAIHHQKRETIRLGIVSRLIPLKNISMLFNAIALLPASIAEQFEVQIFGDGTEFENLKSNAKIITDQIIVKFHGNVIDENIIYNSFDVLVMCSNTEGLPMSILEAMGYGIPVISTDVGAISQVIISKETGYLYAVKATEELSHILKELTLFSNNIHNMGVRAKSFIENNYAISMVYNDYQQLYAGK